METKQQNISLAYGIHRTPTIGHDGELSDCVNLIPRNGELVNILPPTSVTQLNYKLVAVHHISDPDRDNFILRDDGQGGIVYYRGGLDDQELHYTTLAIPEGAAVTPVGNVLCVATSSSIRYYLWQQGSATGYIDLGDADFNIDIQFGIKSHPYTKTAADALTAQLTESVGYYGNWEVLGTAEGSDVSAQADGALEIRDVTIGAGTQYEIEVEPLQHDKEAYIFVVVSTPLVRGTSVWQRVFRGNKGAHSTVITMPDDFGVDEQDAPIRTLEHVTFHVGMATREEGRWVPSSGSEEPEYLPVFIGTTINYVKVRRNSGSSESVQASYRLTQGADLAVGLANEFVSSAAKDSKFVMPFFARYAVKLTTGHMINLSAPCLLEPNTLYAPLLLGQVNVAHNDRYAEVPVSAAVSGYLSELYYRVCEDGALARIRQLGDVVESIVVAITPPVYLYDQSLSEDDLHDVVLKEVRSMSSGGDTWGTNFNRSFTVDGVIENTIDWHSYRFAIPLPASRRDSSGDVIHERMQEALSTWFIVKEISVRSLAETAGWVKLSLEEGDLAAIYAQDTQRFTTLNDTAVTAYKLIGTSGTFAYNNRLFYLGGLQLAHQGWNPVRMSGFTATWTAFSEENTHTVTIQLPGKTISAVFPTNGCPRTQLRFFAFPDASAESITWYGYGNQTKYFRPQGTQELAVAFYFDGTAGGSQQAGGGIEILYPNKLYMSYADQPFALERTATRTFTGTVRAMSVVTEALSQGQFGRFPLYVFTSEGIWSLEVNADGSMGPATPISRDVITQGTKPLQTDKAVFFITAQGLKRIVGATVTLVSGPVHNFNFPDNKIGDIFLTPGYDAWRTLLQNSDIGSSFEAEIQSARLFYDYSQQLVHVLMGNRSSAHYVYSLESGEWAQQCLFEYSQSEHTYVGILDIVVIIPGYPHTFLQGSNHQLYRYDGALKGRGVLANIIRAGYALTRPIDFGDPVGMKALMDFRLVGQRTGPRADAPEDTGDLRKVVILASKDGYTWHPLRSLKAGSYKYFRFLILSRISDYDAITGLACRYQNRRTHRLR